ncbi:NAD(P)-dependent oxidoreductase [Paracoccus sp. P2]|uniref:NAD(P)-dependent oxidoreductase n=1 Tax=Paracoccus sp. P2 TaxID=3248840 RepID=UPI00391EF875
MHFIGEVVDVTDDRVGFVGLGRMGAAMAERLQAAGVPLVVCDVNPDNLAPFVDAGAEVAQSAREVADRARLVFSCLPTTELSLQIALGPEGIAAGKAVEVYVDTGTIGVTAAREIASAMRASIGFLDAPVSGGPNGARAGTLTTMVSGPQASFAAVQPILAIMAPQVFHVGEQAGQAQLAKLINNHLSAAGRLAAFEGLVVAMKAGIDPMRLLQVVNAGTGRNHTTLEKIPAAVRSGQFAYGARLANSIKDESLLMDEAAALGVPLWVAPRMVETLKAAAAAGYLDQDSMFLIQFMGEQAGIDARALLESADV